MPPEELSLQAWSPPENGPEAWGPMINCDRAFNIPSVSLSRGSNINSFEIRMWIQRENTFEIKIYITHIGSS